MGYDRDVLAELFSEPEVESQPEQAELIRLIYRRGSKEVGVERSQPSGSIGDCRRKIRNKKKKTYYLSDKLVVELFQGKARIKMQVPSELKAKVTMSRIVDTAIGAILKEFNQVGTPEDLMHQFLTDTPKRV